MSDKPGDPSDEQPNPFKGTPFEAIFNQLGGMGGLGNLGNLGNLGGQGGAGGNPFAGIPGLGGPGGGMPDLSALFGQIQSMLQPYDGPLNWQVATDVARRTVATEPDPTPTEAQRSAVADALRLADHWLDGTTSFPSGVTTTAAWSRAEWVEQTMESWKAIVEPLAERSVGAMSSAMPEEARAQAGPLLGFLAKAVGGMLAQQVGSGLGTLAGEVLGVSDVGVPLAPAGRAALLPTNVAAFAEGLDIGPDDVLLYLALREAAHQRLFAAVPWLRSHVSGAVADYARGIDVNIAGMQQRVEEQMRGLDLTNPEGLQGLLEGGMFEMPDTPAQRAALERLEIVLALVEGWVDEIVGQATAERMPVARKLQEVMRRRRAEGGPAEHTFATLVGLEMRPRRLRDASTLWGSLRTRQGTEGRDGVWTHPDLLPSAADLDDPLAFREDAATPQDLSPDDFDAELRRLLDGPAAGSAGDTSDDTTGDTSGDASDEADGPDGQGPPAS